MPIQIDGRSLVPDIAGQFARGQQTTQALENQRLAGQRQQQLIDQTKAQALGDQQAAQQATQARTLAGQVVGGQLPEGTTQQQAIGRIFAENPQLAEKTLKTLGVQDQAGADELADFAFQVQNSSPEQISSLIQQRAQNLTNQNRDPKDTLDLLNLGPDQLNKVLDTMQLAALTTKEQFTEKLGGVQSSAFIPGKGFAVLSKGGEAEFVPVGGVGETALEKREAEIQKSARIEGRKALLQGKSAAVKQAINKGAAAFDKIQPISTAIANYDEAISALDSGAETGVIASMLPSFKKASIELDNVVKRLGLDVIGNTTFGALSESELAFALKAAIPDNLQPADLKQWLIAKRDAQKKVKARVEEAATFLSNGTHTISDWVEFDKAKQLNQQNQVSEQPRQVPEMLARPAQAAGGAVDLGALSIEELIAERNKLGGK